MVKIIIGIIMIITDINISTAGGFPIRNLWWFSFVSRPNGIDILPDFVGFILIFLGIKQLTMLVYPNVKLSNLLQKMALGAGAIALVDFLLRLFFGGSLSFLVYKIVAFFCFITFMGVLAGLALFFKQIQYATRQRMRHIEFAFTVAIYACLSIIMALNAYGERFTLTVVVSVCFVIDMVYMIYVLTSNRNQISKLER